jgi:hypothetical protein
MTLQAPAGEKRRKGFIELIGAADRKRTCQNENQHAADQRLAIPWAAAVLSDLPPRADDADMPV